MIKLTNKSLYMFNLNRLSSARMLLGMQIGRRTILSEAYSCNEAWQKRLESPILKNIKMDQYFIDTDKKFNVKNAVSGVDIDLFANNVQDISQLEELEHLLYRFRRTRRSPEMMDSTICAAVRIFLYFKDFEGLFRLLKNYESYGIFPNFYTYNFLMDTFIKENMFKEATEVAILMMLQEDFSNEISCLLSIYSCQMFLKTGPLEAIGPQKEEEKVEENDDEEETLVRVPFLLNPFFDDHFHLTKPEHLIGKTFFLAGRHMEKETIGVTYQLLGLAMYEKWDKLSEKVESLVSNESPSILSEGIEEIKKYLETVENSEIKSQVEISLAKLQESNKIKPGKLEDALNSRLKDLSSLEEQDIKKQKELFLDWDQKRNYALKQQNSVIEKQRRLEEIAKKKEYLYWKEKLLFFFENENKILDEYETACKKTVLLQSEGKEVDTYMPPEISKLPTPRLTKYQRLAKVKKLDKKIL